MSRIVRFPVPRDRTVDSPPLVPVVPTRGRIPDSIDRTLSELAADPDASTPAVRNALFTAYWPLLSRISRKVWWHSARRGYVELEDVQQESFLTFTALLASWSGEGSFSRFLLGRFHWRHLDLMDVLSGYQARARAGLSDIAVLLGFPGKLGFDGSQVWDAYLRGELARIRHYCETDVLNTWLVFLRFQYMRGRLSAAGLADELLRTRAWLTEAKQPHFDEFLAAWTT